MINSLKRELPVLPSTEPDDGHRGSDRLILLSLSALGIVFTIMATWRRGREILAHRLEETKEPLELFLLRIAEKPPLRVPGTDVFLVKPIPGTPSQLLHHLAHNQVLHEQVVFLSVVTREVPRVTAEKRLEVIRLEQGFSQVIVNCGFMQSPICACCLAGM